MTFSSTFNTFNDFLPPYVFLASEINDNQWAKQGELSTTLLETDKLRAPIYQ